MEISFKALSVGFTSLSYMSHRFSQCFISFSFCLKTIVPTVFKGIHVYKPTYLPSGEIKDGCACSHEEPTIIKLHLETVYGRVPCLPVGTVLQSGQILSQGKICLKSEPYKGAVQRHPHIVFTLHAGHPMVFGFHLHRLPTAHQFPTCRCLLYGQQGGITLKHGETSHVTFTHLRHIHPYRSLTTRPLQPLAGGAPI